MGGGGGHCEFCGKDGEQDSIDEQIQYFHHHSVCVVFLYNTLNICIQGLLLMFISYALSLRDATLFTLFFISTLFILCRTVVAFNIQPLIHFPQLFLLLVCHKD